MGTEDAATPYARIISSLEELGPGPMAASAAECMSMVADGRRPFPEALPGMTSGEARLGRERIIGSQTGKASFPYVKTLQDFGWSFRPSVPGAEIEDLPTPGFAGRHENVAFVGSPGVGKAHLAAALGVEAVRHRRLTYFVGCQHLVGDLGRAADKGRLERRMRFHSHLSLPMLDGPGCLQIDKRGADLIFQLVSRRCEKRPAIVTTNVGMGLWADVFGNAAAASAIAGRLCHHCHPIRITGRSCRTKDLPAGKPLEGGRRHRFRLIPLPVLVDLYCPGWCRNLAHIGRSGVDFNNSAETFSLQPEDEFSEQVKRGDLELVKVTDGDQKRLAGVPFSITSKTTGESHTVVTDANGYASTYASWNLHTNDTNGGRADSGVWFGGGDPDDSKGALVYDTYTVEEQRCEANADRALIPAFDVTVYRDGATVNLGTLTNDEGPRVGTTATDASDGDHEATEAKAVKIADDVAYSGLEPGKEHKLSGTLMDRETGEPIQSAGKDVTSTVSFAPEKASGTVEVHFEFDGSALAGHDVVAFESLDRDGREVATHADIDDEGQTVKLVSPPVEETPAGETVKGSLPKTGDDAPWVPLACAAGAAACAAGAIALVRAHGRRLEDGSGSVDSDGGEE
jgi:DNA replication protein DnaC